MDNIILDKVSTILAVTSDITKLLDDDVITISRRLNATYISSKKEYEDTLRLSISTIDELTKDYILLEYKLSPYNSNYKELSKSRLIIRSGIHKITSDNILSHTPSDMIMSKFKKLYTDANSILFEDIFNKDDFEYILKYLSSYDK